jgi:ssDNA-binding Zn-finger/Zn-ribbon topoisomerase 1
MSKHVEVDLSDEACPLCEADGGRAVVALRPPKRYFWGCSRFPQCKGPSEWSWFLVPEALKVRHARCESEPKTVPRPPDELLPQERAAKRQRDDAQGEGKAQ